LDRTNCW